MTTQRHQANSNGIISFGKISPAQYQEMFGTIADQRIQNNVHATYFGWDSPINGGTGVWVHDHVTDEVVEKLRKLPHGVDQTTINKNLETVGAVYYEHWEMHPHAKNAMMPYDEADRLDRPNRRGAERL